MKKRFSTYTVVIFCCLALLSGMQISTVISGDNIFEQLGKFKDVLSLTEKYYVEEIDTQKLVEAAINGLLNQLDPHSVYIPASKLSAINEEFQGSFDGIGVEFEVVSETLLVVSPIAGGPSEALGILGGDKILKINDTSCIGIKEGDVPKKLRGPKGTHVKVSISRAGVKDLMEYDIVRDKISIYTVDASFLYNGDVGYVRINRFAQTTHDEFLSAITKLRSEGMKKMVLDLRDNPGGFLEQAFKLADEMLPAGKKVVYTKGRRSEFDEEYVSSGSGKLLDVPLIVLVDHSSASASEIVSGAIQDWDRGLIVGETTFGKGLVQRQYDLSDKSAFRLTIAKYYTPSGRLIQRPYGADHAAYRSAVIEDQAEGENVEHKEERDSTRQAFRTAGGRVVYGGGGITPDYIIRGDTLTHYAADLRRNRVFDDFTAHYMDRNGKAIRQEYGSDVEKFAREFEVNDDMLKELTDLAAKKGVKFDEGQYKHDIVYIKDLAKAQIAHDVWGFQGSVRVMLSHDSQFQKSVTLFPEAEKISGLR